MKELIYITVSILLLSGCSRNKNKADAYGSFEADEIMVSAEVNGKLLNFNIEEGMQVDKDKIVGYIDSSVIYLQYKQALAQKETVNSKIAQVKAQKEVYETQLETLNTERERIEKLYKDKAATAQQKDEINGKIDILKKQLLFVNTQYQTIIKEIKSIDIQIEILKLNLEKCKIKNPVKAIVLEKYIDPYELVNMGRSLYKITDLDNLYLKAYVSEPQLSIFNIGDTVNVYCDMENKNKQEYKGIVSWVSSKAEFTPKVVQTAEERVNLVYAVRIRVKNNGLLKIGMPGEVHF